MLDLFSGADFILLKKEIEHKEETKSDDQVFGICEILRDALEQPKVLEYLQELLLAETVFLNDFFAHHRNFQRRASYSREVWCRCNPRQKYKD